MSAVYDIAKSGLRVADKQLAVISTNVANESNPNYSVQSTDIGSVIVAGRNMGPKLLSVQRFYDENLNSAIREQTSLMSKDEAILSHMNSIKTIIGASSIDDPRSPEKLVSNFFASIYKLSGSVLDLSLKAEAISNANNLAINFADMSSKLYEARYQVDIDIAQAITKVNEIIVNLRDTNIALNSSSSNQGDDINYYQNRDSLLKELAQYIDIKANIDSKSGIVSVSTSMGKTLLAGSTYGELNYTPTTSKGDFENHLTINPMSINLYDYSGSLLRTDILVTSGIDGDDIQTVLQGGKIKGLLEMRDNTIPKITQVLDNLSKEVMFQVNKIHNTGSGYPPLTGYVGTRPVGLTDYTEWQGGCKIAIVDETGKPFVRQDGTEFKPLHLDLSNLDSGNGVARPTTQTIIDEINEYFHFAPGVSRVGINDATSTNQIFRDVKIVAVDDIVSSAASNVLRFAMEIDSSSQFDATFEIMNIAVTDAAAAVLPAASTTITNGYSLIKAGTKAQTEQQVSVDIGAVPNPPYSIDVTYRALGSDGAFSTGVITYIINPPNQHVRNERFVASNATINAVLNPPDGEVYATANLVDVNGNIISPGNNSTKGFLSIQTNIAQYRIIIDDETSADAGLPAMYGLSAVQATQKGFGHYFGLNDFFVQNFDDENYALDMAVRSDILDSPNLLSVAKLVISNNLQEQEVRQGDLKASATMNFQNGTNVTANDTITIIGRTMKFVNALTGAANEVIIGATLDDTLNNLAASLNQLYFPDVFLTENLSNGGAYSLKFTASQPGVGSNNLPVSANFGVIQADLGAGMATTPAGVLAGGTSTTAIISIERYGYNIGRDSNQVILDLAGISKQSFFIDSAGGIPGGTMTLSGYATNFIANSIAKISSAQQRYENSKIIHDGYQETYESKSAVNIEEQISQLIQVQHFQHALTKVMQVANRMNDALLEVF